MVFIFVADMYITRNLKFPCYMARHEPINYLFVMVTDLFTS